MNEPIVSIIIPFFNEEDRIGRCLTSVLSSSYSNFELLLIDDGSTDKSVEICKKCVEKDNRINLFNLSNGGVSKARNYGLSKAKGEYIWFVDADDEVYEQSLDLMLKAIQTDEADLCIGKYNSERANDYQSDIECTLSIDKYIENICKNDCMYYFVLWNKLFKREIITSNNITFNEEYFFGEDGIFNLEYLRQARKISFVNKEIYYYSEGYNNGRKKPTTVERETSIYKVLRDGYIRKMELAKSLNITVENDLNSQYFYQIKNILTKLIDIKNKEYKTLITSIWSSREYSDAIACKTIKGKSVIIARISKALNTKWLFIIYLKITHNKG